jgi:uncharacterized RDD family membrane protein YckC
LRANADPPKNRTMADKPGDGARYRVAGFWWRATAAAVDGLVLLPLMLLFAGVTATVGGGTIPRLGELGLGYLVNLALNGGAVGPAALVMATIVGALYFFIFHAMRGQTPGKRLLGLRVIDAWGERPTWARALVRTGGYALSALLFSLGFLWIGFDREKRGLHDWLAGTYVVVTPRAAAAPAVPAPPPMAESTP